MRERAPGGLKLTLGDGEHQVALRAQGSATECIIAAAARDVQTHAPKARTEATTARARAISTHNACTASTQP